MEKGWIDSHAHLCDEGYQQELDQLIERAKENGIVRIMVIACNIQEAKQAMTLKAQYSMLDIAAGFHPEDADTVTDSMLTEFKQLLDSRQFDAIGEIGLDYYWRKDNKEKQQELFIKQLAIAEAYQLPVLIHCRDATQDSYDLLKAHPVSRTGIMHCYGGSVEMAKEFIKLGYYIALGGPVTFKNAVTPKEVAKTIPLDHLLTETDCPYLTPHPYRGKRNEPMYVRYSGEEIACLREMDVIALQEAIQTNYERLIHQSKIEE